MLATGQWLGVEALLRWQHDELGWISPAEIVPLARQNGQLDALTSWLLDAGLRAAGAVASSAARDLTMSINVTGDQVPRPGLPQAGAPARWIAIS